MCPLSRATMGMTRGAMGGLSRYPYEKALPMAERQGSGDMARHRTPFNVRPDSSGIGSIEFRGSAPSVTLRVSLSAPCAQICVRSIQFYGNLRSFPVFESTVVRYAGGAEWAQRARLELQKMGATA